MSDNDGGNPLNLNLGNLLQQARGVQQRLEEARAAAAAVTVEGNAGGGMVVAQANGKGQVLRVSIEPTLLATGDREMLEDLVAAAVNQALELGRAAMQDEMSKVTGGMPMPFDLSNLV
jgi:hypothetical protein